MTRDIPLPLALLLALVPFACALSAFVVGIDKWVVYLPAKCLLTVFAVRFALSCGKPARPTASGIWTGFLMAVAILTAFAVIPVDPAGIHSTFGKMGVGPTAFVAVGAFTALFNSFVEESIFRGMLQSSVNRVFPGRGWLVQGMAFVPHHAVVLFLYFPTGTACLCLAGVALAGLFWGAARNGKLPGQKGRGMSLSDLFLSHAIADLAAIGCGLILYLETFNG